jgi:GT2 family glycosyltransferase/spore maturation protein CgeB
MESWDEHKATAARLRTELREREAEVRRLRAGSRDTLALLRRVERSRAWRLGHGAMKIASRLAGRGHLGGDGVAEAVASLERALGMEQAAAPQEVATRRVIPQPCPDELGALGRSLRRRLGTAPADGGPSQVSVITLTRPGSALAPALAASLEATDPGPIRELIIVVDGKPDSELRRLADNPFSFEVRVISTPGLESFSSGCNLGAREAEGSELLFLNDDVVAFEDGWLRELRAARSRHGAAMAGALLLRASAGDGAVEVQHAGIDFALERGAPRARNFGAGEPAEAYAGEADRACAAVTGACALIGRGAFEQVGGFDEDYRWGTEDVDLGLKLVVGGHPVVCCRRSVLYHGESITQRGRGGEFMRECRRRNRRRFLERWGPALARSVSLTRLAGGGLLSTEPATLVVARSSHDPSDGFGDYPVSELLARAAEHEGLRVSLLAPGARTGWDPVPEGTDVILSLSEHFEPQSWPVGQRFAWVRGWTDRWIAAGIADRYDLALGASGSIRAALAAAGASEAPFPPATDPAVFAPSQTSHPPRADLVLVANRWGRRRAIEDWLKAPPGRSLVVHGRGWEGTSLAQHAHGPIAWQAIPEVYRGARLVLDDAAEHTAPWGVPNSRVLDALACGTPVLTGAGEAIRTLLGQEIPAFVSRESLATAIDEILGDEESARDRAGQARDEILRRHTFGHRVRTLRALASERATALTVAILICAPDRIRAPWWGDLHYGEALRRELVRRGVNGSVLTLDEWEDERAMVADVVIHLQGLSHYDPRPGQLNVVWGISHPDRLSPAECDAYDLAFVAGPRHAERLCRSTRTPVHVLRQATDPRVFFPQPVESHRTDAVLVANSRGVDRPAIAALRSKRSAVRLWGAGWEGRVPPHRLAGEHLEPTEVRHAYSSATVVLNDHWDDMREAGYVSNRVFDALACATPVLSDDCPELADLGEGVATYGSEDELLEKLEALVASPQEARRRGEAGRRAVLGAHTFSHRVDVMLPLMDERLDEVGIRRTVRETTARAQPSRRGLIEHFY